MPGAGAAAVRAGHLGPGLCLLWGGVIWKQGGSPSPWGATLSRGPWPGLNAQGLLCVSAARPASSPCSPPRPPPSSSGEAESRLRGGLTQLTPEGSPSCRVSVAGGWWSVVRGSVSPGTAGWRE